jgi:hypothetical protein
MLLVAGLTLSAPRLVAGVGNRETAYVYGTDNHGVTRQLAADRTPALYTSDFGDCLGGKSLFNISAFDAAYYADNMTVVFHLDGTSNVHNESTMRTWIRSGLTIQLREFELTYYRSGHHNGSMYVNVPPLSGTGRQLLTLTYVLTLPSRWRDTIHTNI